MVKPKIGIFQGKQAEYNRYLLETLYFNGPLTAWELAKRSTKEYKLLHVRHAIFNKRLRSLEKKDYVQKCGKYWALTFKGIIAVLLSLPKPKPFSEKWIQIVENYLKKIKDVPKITIQQDGIVIFNVSEHIKKLGENLRNFKNWIDLSNKLKEIMDKGFINFDVIKNESLFALIIIESGGVGEGKVFNH